MNQTCELDLLLENAKLRDQMEPFIDESIYMVDLDRMSTHNENQYLTSLLAWERAPVLPIGQWFDPQLVMKPHEELDDTELKQELHQIIGRLYEKHLMLQLTGHLSDRQLYCLINRDILPAEEKKVVLPDNYLRWQCLDMNEDEESWLRFYASEEDRQKWAFETGLKLPPRLELPFKRKLPQHQW